ncbi:MAG: hypothetical protein J7502_13120 [Flavisolibacter sp.]|nr:hypothetical protein [Flavisolibacter sp.]
MQAIANPFEYIIDRINSIDAKLEQKNTTPSLLIEIIDRPELMKRLRLTEPTIIRYEKKKVIPRIEIGSAVRYNWPAVIAALENRK